MQLFVPEKQIICVMGKWLRLVLKEVEGITYKEDVSC